MYLGTGILGFLFFFLYDFNTVFFRIRAGKFLFPLGALMIIFATAGQIYMSRGSFCVSRSSILCMIMASIMLVLLVYTLFFALPVKDAYSGEMGEELLSVCDKGMYALCRHPGVIWFVGLALFLYLLFPTKNMGILMAVLSAMNFAYIALQDIVIFPRQFADYREYKMSTPFLLPTINSIRRAAETGRKEFDI